MILGTMPTFSGTAYRQKRCSGLFEKLNYREQTLLEKRLAICMTCGRVGSWKGRPTFEELAVMFEGSTASGAERAYRKAVDRLTELLVAEGAIHAVRLKQKSENQAPKSKNCRRNLRIPGRLRRRMGRDFLGF